MNYKWDLTRIFKDEKEYNESINEVNKLLDEIISYKGKILESDKTFLELLNLETKIDKLLSKIYVYSYLGFYDDMGDVKFQGYKESASSLMVKAGSVTSFIVPEVLSSEYSVVLEYIDKNKELELYRYSLEKIFREKSHILSEKEEKILSDLGEIMDIPNR